MRVTPVASLVLLFAAACGSSNPHPEGQPTPGRTSRGGMIVDSARRNTVIENDRPDAPPRAGLLVVANQQGASATVLNAASLQTIATVPVGNGPHEVAVSPDGRWAVVSVYGDRGAPGNTLSVIDLGLATPAISRTIDLGQYTRPHGVAFVLGGSKLAVTSETTQRLVIVDFASGRVDTALATNGRGSHMVAVRRDLRRAWTGNIQDGTVTEFDLDTRRTGRTYPAASMDEGIAATPGGVQVWVGSNDQHVGLPYRIGVSRSSRVAVVNDPVKNRIWIYEVGTRQRLAEIDLSKEQGVPPTAGGQPGQEGAGPEGVAFDPIADFAYVTLHGTNQVVAVDLNRLKVTAVGSVGAG
ncbi:MAG: YncE family protein, partial [Gemmatimonadaceae bacterium]|nr:YncE family protein [Gemmatimonadaceae bacterium]